jgi:hypothetical protein
VVALALAHQVLVHVRLPRHLRLPCSWGCLLARTDRERDRDRGLSLHRRVLVAMQLAGGINRSGSGRSTGSPRSLRPHVRLLAPVDLAVFRGGACSLRRRKDVDIGALDHGCAEVSERCMPPQRTSVDLVEAHMQEQPAGPRREPSWACF